MGIRSVNSLNTLINIVNRLRVKGSIHLASDLDVFLRRNAQELGDLDLDDIGIDEDGGEAPEMSAEPDPTVTEEPIEPKVSDEKGKLQRTFYYQFEEWHRLIDRELPYFDYWGEDNISNLRHSFSNVHRALEQVMGDRKLDFDPRAGQTFDAQLDEIERRLKESRNAVVNATKAKVDASLLYGTTKRLHQAFERCTKDDPDFSKAAEEFGTLMRVFALTIQNNAEEIAKVDLTEVR